MGHIFYFPSEGRHALRIFTTPEKSNGFGKTDKLMLHREIIAVCSEIHARHTNALYFCMLKLEVDNVSLRL
jgi:hypothetical protein